MTEHDQKLFSEYQLATYGAAEMRLRDCLIAIDDLKSLAHRADAAKSLRINRHEIKHAMRGLVDLWQDLGLEDDVSPVVHLSELRELRRA